MRAKGPDSAANHRPLIEVQGMNKLLKSPPSPSSSPLGPAWSHRRVWIVLGVLAFSSAAVFAWHLGTLYRP